MWAGELFSPHHCSDSCWPQGRWHERTRLIEDTRSLGYTQLTPTATASALQSIVPGSTASGSTLTVSRSLGASAPTYTFSATFTACSMDDPADGYGSHSDAPTSGGSWCADVASAGSTDANGAQTFSGTVVKQGDKYVLKDDAGKTYDIDHQTDVAKFEGKRVRVQGTLDPSGKIMVK